MSVVDDQDRDAASPFSGPVERATVRLIPAPALLSRRADPSVHGVNGVTAALILALLVLSPIPLGSNRPAFWMIWSTYVGVLSFGYGAVLLWLGANPRVPLARLWPEASALLLLCLFIGVQSLPLGQWLPDSMVLLEPLGVRLGSISFDPGSTRLVLIQFFTFGLLFFIATEIAVNRRRARRMLLAVLVVISLFALFGLVSLMQLGDTLLGFDKQFYKGYATGTFINRNSFATYLATGLVFGVPLLLQAARERDRILTKRLASIGVIVVCLAAIAACLLATGSRMGAVAAGAGVVVTAVLGLLVYRGSFRLGAVLVVVAAVAAIAVVALFGTGLIERLVLLPGVDEGRAEAHRQIWAAILERPWFGYGAGSFASVFPMIQQAPLSGEFVWDNTHSTYLALWFELGLVAGSIPLLIIVLVGWRSLRALREPSSHVTSLAAIGAIVVFGVHSLLDFSAEIEANAFLFTVILALGAAGAIGGRTTPDTA
jgi:hypothetical protein